LLLALGIFVLVLLATALEWTHLSIAALLGATGYFPVGSRPGQEWAGSTLIVPSGTWFDRSEFILWPYPRPVVAQPLAIDTNAVVPESGSEPKSE
jgi:hypothetical protein